ncbi:hypothetical protein [Actinoplanes sp. NPDC051411]|uniref:DUF2207 family protein n=1 Tax=Actinoplanes sp. NPDC051411 TaxID=3155522 RepID=UPI003445C153
MLDIIIAGAAAGLWLIAYGVCRLATRTVLPPAGPATMDLGPEPPAVVSMLVNDWSRSVGQAESTVLDLAAAKYYELRQPDNDPFRTTLHLARNPPDERGLRPYERQVLDRIRGLAVGGVVPVTALAFRDQNESKAWNQRLSAAVVAEARAAGLSRRRFGRTMMTALYSGALAVGLVCGFAAVHRTHNAWTFLCFLTVAGVLAGLVQHVGERDTPAGLEAASRWFGVQAWLRNHEQFADLPPSAVAIWDRYLAYGAALGVTRRASAVLDLEVGDRRNIWSSYGGGWHRVRVRYPRGRPWYGRTTRSLILRTFVFLVVGAVDVSVAGRASRYSLPGYVLLTVGVYMLIRTMNDLARSASVTGEVIGCRTSRANNSHSRLDYLVIDDGTADRTTAWALPSEWRNRCHDGDVVTITVQPWTRRVVAVTQHSRGIEQTGALAVDFFGEVREVSTGPLPVSVEDVARLVGQPVRAEVQPQRVDFRSEVDNTVVLRAEWAGGLAGRIAWRANARGNVTPLPGIGDEAYASGNRVVMRTGDRTLVVAALAGGRVGIPHLPWLLARGERV